jgi:hypothetical protein
MIEDERNAGDPRGPGITPARRFAAAFGDPTPLRRRPAAPMLGGRSPNFVALWFIVSGLWTVATVCRIQRTWCGLPSALSSRFTWVSLVLPPLLFALVLLAMSRIADNHQRRGR